MWEKFKKIVIKIPLWSLVIYFVLSTLIIIWDRTSYNLSFLNQFETEWIKELVAWSKDLKIIYNKIKWVFYTLYLIDILLIIFRIILKNDSIKVMIINTFENTKVNIRTKYTYENKEFYKDLSNEVKILKSNYLNYGCIVKKIDGYVEEFMEQKKERYYAFAGILHTPFILRLGFKIGDQTYFKLFHKKRDEDIFKLLKDNKNCMANYPEINVEKELKGSNELVVSIATTFEITKRQLNKFDIENNNYIKFETTTKGFDVIESEDQVNEYKKIIFDEIRAICREKNIKKIHLCISSSVAFTFALGQGFSENYDPAVIIYNYEKQEYTWGLKLFENSENSIIYVGKDLMKNKKA